MTLERPIVESLGPLFGAEGSPPEFGSGRVYFNKAPIGRPNFPMCILQQAGGQTVNGFCGQANGANMRLGVWVWASTSQQALTLLRQVAVILTEPPFRGVTLDEPVAEFNEPTDAFGARQDFSLWYYR